MNRIVRGYIRKETKNVEARGATEDKYQHEEGWGRQQKRKESNR